jgi:hypothetical protein
LAFTVKPLLKATSVKPGGFFHFPQPNGKFLPVCVKLLTESGKLKLAHLLLHTLYSPWQAHSSWASPGFFTHRS